MKYPKFKLAQDIEIEIDTGVKALLYRKGKEFTADENGMYGVKWFGGTMCLDAKHMIETKHEGEFIFEEVKGEEINLIIEEIGDDDDNLVMSWRIQLDVKTTKKKLKEIEKMIREYITPIIY